MMRGEGLSDGADREILIEDLKKENEKLFADVTDLEESLERVENESKDQILHLQGQLESSNDKLEKLYTTMNEMSYQVTNHMQIAEEKSKQLKQIK